MLHRGFILAVAVHISFSQRRTSIIPLDVEPPMNSKNISFQQLIFLIYLYKHLSYLGTRL